MMQFVPITTSDVVALRKESVDRNLNNPVKVKVVEMSLSARRAWIEILRGPHICRSGGSLSARRAWIEIG